MTPTVDSGAAPSAPPADVFTMIGNDLAAAGFGTQQTSQDTTSQQPVQTPAEPQQPAAATPAQSPAPTQPGAAEGADQTTPTEEAQQPPIDDAEGLKPEGVEVSDSRWQRMVAANRYARELAKGLGIVAEDDTAPLDLSALPAVEDLRAAMERSSTLESMEADFTSGRPEDARNMVEQWNRISPEGMVRFASQLPDVMAQLNPNAYQAVATPVITRFIDFMYDAAASEARPEMQNAILHGAQLAEWWATGGPQGGRYRSADEIQRKIQAAKADPLAAERERLAQERQSLDQHYQRMEQEAWQGWRSGTNSEIDKQVAGIAEEALGQLKAAAPPEHYTAIKDAFIRKIHERVKSNQVGWRGFNNHYDLAQRNFKTDQKLRESLVSEYMRMARPAAMALKARYVTEQTQALVAQNQARNAQLQQSAQKVGPASAGQPVARDMTAAVLERQPNESHSDYMLRMIQADMAKAGYR